MNLYDILLARCICSNKSEESIVVTPLEVTENGEYEAEEGYAYNPVTVNNKLSFANVTFTNNTSDDIEFGCTHYVGEGSFDLGATLGTGESITVEAILYEQAAFCQITASITLTEENVVITGDAIIESVSGYIANLTLSGDCTITITE